MKNGLGIVRSPRFIGLADSYPFPLQLESDPGLIQSAGDENAQQGEKK